MPARAVYVVQKVSEKGSPFSSLQLDFSLVPGVVQKRKERKILVIIVLNIEQLLLKLLFIYSYMYILASLTSEAEFMGFILFALRTSVCIREISHTVRAFATCLPQRLGAGTNGWV